jgi:hypothetical protein
MAAALQVHGSHGTTVLVCYDRPTSTVIQNSKAGQLDSLLSMVLSAEAIATATFGIFMAVLVLIAICQVAHYAAPSLRRSVKGQVR